MKGRVDTDFGNPTFTLICNRIVGWVWSNVRSRIYFYFVLFTDALAHLV